MKKMHAFRLLVLLLFSLPFSGSASTSNDIVSFIQSIGVEYNEDCNNLSLYQEIKGWINTPYKYAGKTKKGVDCAGFVNAIVKTVYGIQLAYSAGSQFLQCQAIERSELEEGDLVFFKIRKNYISHVGLYLGNGKFVHAAVHGGVMINDLNENYYHKYYYISGRIS